MKNMTERREILAWIGTMTTIVGAGCTSSSDIAGGNDSDRTPEETAYQYWTASINGNTEAVNDALHPESGNYPVEDVEDTSDLYNPTITETTEVSPREWATQSKVDDSEELSEEEIQTKVDNIESVMENAKNVTGAKEVVLVLMSFESGERTFTVVKDSDDWLLYINA